MVVVVPPVFHLVTLVVHDLSGQPVAIIRMEILPDPTLSSARKKPWLCIDGSHAHMRPCVLTRKLKVGVLSQVRCVHRVVVQHIRRTRDSFAGLKGPRRAVPVAFMVHAVVVARASALGS